MSSDTDSHFRNFAASLEAVIAGYGSDDEDFTAKQKKQVELLVDCERQWRKALIKDWRGPLVYRDFVKYILDERRNILAARPYFRERQDIFKTKISPLLRNRQEKSLYQFDINYPFIAFAMKARKFGTNSKVQKLATAVKDIRKEIIELNLPLAISRARIFRNKVPQSHLEYMDLVQISNEGLIAAVDKFVLPYSPVFRAVIIGRITGNLIDDYSDTMLHFYPSDKRKIYRANKLQKQTAVNVSWDDVAEQVNKGVENQHKTSASEVRQLMQAASHVSMNSSAPSMTGNEKQDVRPSETSIYAADESQKPDVIVENAELKDVLSESIRGLTCLERKLLRLKGVEA